MSSYYQTQKIRTKIRKQKRGAKATIPASWSSLYEKVYIEECDCEAKIIRSGRGSYINVGFLQLQNNEEITVSPVSL